MTTKKEGARAEAVGANQITEQNSTARPGVLSMAWLDIGSGYCVRFSGVPGMPLVSTTWRPVVPPDIRRLLATRCYQEALAAFVECLEAPAHQPPAGGAFKGGWS